MRAGVAVLLVVSTHALGADDAASAPMAPAASAPDWHALNHQAAMQAKAGDMAGMHGTLLALAPLMPGSPAIAYNLGATAARLGHVDEALQQIDRLADAGLVYDLTKDEDFASLGGQIEYRAIREQFARNARPVGSSTTLARLADGDGLPEALAWDAGAKRLFIAGVRHCEVLAMDDPRRKGAREHRFARLPASVFALAVDRAHERLWATIASVAQADRCGEAAPQQERTALLALDLRTGRVVQRIEAGVPGVLGDMLLADDGSIVVTESVHGAVLRLRPGAKAFERLDPPGEFASPQMPATSADGRTLLVPDYGRGIGAIELAAPGGPVRWLPNGRAVFTAGIDGLVRDGDGFVAVQNGTSPPRLVRLSADLMRQQVLESGTPGLGEPTHAVIVDGKVWFIADVGWDRFNEDGGRKVGAPPAHPELRQLDVPAR